MDGEQIYYIIYIYIYIYIYCLLGSHLGLEKEGEMTQES